MSIMTHEASPINSEAFTLACSAPTDPIASLPWRLRPVARFLAKPRWDDRTAERIAEISARWDDEYTDEVAELIEKADDMIRDWRNIAKRGMVLPTTPNPANIFPTTTSGVVNRSGSKAKPSRKPARSKAPAMSPEDSTKSERLASLKNSSTLYELAIVRGAERYRVCYSARKSRDGMFDAVTSDGRAELLVAFTGSEDIKFAKRAADGGTMGEWSVIWTGRTERQAISEGELTHFTKATSPVSFPDLDQVEAPDFDEASERCSRCRDAAETTVVTRHFGPESLCAPCAQAVIADGQQVAPEPTIDVTVTDLAKDGFRLRDSLPFGFFASDVIPARVDELAAAFAKQDAEMLPKSCFEPHPHPWFNSHTYCKILQEQVKGLPYYIALQAVAKHFPVLFAPDDEPATPAGWDAIEADDALPIVSASVMTDSAIRATIEHTPIRGYEGFGRTTVEYMGRNDGSLRVGFTDNRDALVLDNALTDLRSALASAGYAVELKYPGSTHAYLMVKSHSFPVPILPEAIPPISGGSPVAELAEPQASVYPFGDFDPTGRTYRAEMRAIESTIRAEVTDIIRVHRDGFEGRETDGGVTAIAELAWEALCRENDGFADGFAAWLDWIGYRPGFADYGRLAPDEAWTQFLIECIDGAICYSPTTEPTDPEGSDDDTDLRAGHQEARRPSMELDPRTVHGRMGIGQDVVPLVGALVSELLPGGGAPALPGSGRVGCQSLAILGADHLTPPAREWSELLGRYVIDWARLDPDTPSTEQGSTIGGDAISSARYNADGQGTVNPSPILNTTSHSGERHVVGESYHPGRVPSSDRLPALPSGERRVSLEPDRPIRSALSHLGSMAEAQGSRQQARPEGGDSLYAPGEQGLHPQGCSPRPGSVRGAEANRDASLPRPRSISDEQQPVESPMGYARRQHAGLDETRSEHSGISVEVGQAHGGRHPDHSQDGRRGDQSPEDSETFLGLGRHDHQRCSPGKLEARGVESPRFSDTLVIRGTTYGLERHDWGFTLERADGTLHEVTVRPDGSVRCSCPDHYWRGQDNPGHLCKHIQGCRDAGLIPPVAQADAIPVSIHPMPTLDTLVLV